MPLLVISLKQMGHHLKFAKQGRNIRSHSLASCPAQLEPAWAEKGRGGWSVRLQLSSSPAVSEPVGAAGLER